MNGMVRLVISVKRPCEIAQSRLRCRVDLLDQLERGAGQPRRFQPFALKRRGRLERDEALERKRTRLPRFVCPLHSFADQARVLGAANGLVKLAIRAVDAQRSEMKILLAFIQDRFENLTREALQFSVRMRVE